MTVIVIIVSLVLSAFNYEPWWLDTNPQYQKEKTMTVTEMQFKPKKGE
jgi:hypothetical protein